MALRHSATGALRAPYLVELYSHCIMNIVPKMFTELNRRDKCSTILTNYGDDEIVMKCCRRDNSSRSE